MTDWKALCAALIDEVPCESPTTCLARAALAQQHVSQPYKLPEPVAPTQGEAVAVYTEVMVVHDCQTLGDMAEHFARAVLAKWGRNDNYPASRNSAVHHFNPLEEHTND
jgi:hypothetical protein